MKIFKILLLVFGVAIIAAPVVLIYGFIADDTTVDVERVEFTNFESFGNRELYYALENTQTTAKANLSVSQEELNGLLQYLQDEYVPTQASEYLKQFYVLIDGTNYDFYVEVKTPFFNTRITLQTTLDYIPVDEDDAFYFKINKFGAGKLLGDGTLTTSITNMFIKDQDINNAAANAGFNINVDLKNLSITYKVNDLFNDVKEKMGHSDDSMILADIAELIIGEQLIDFNFDSSINVGLKLEKLHENEDYVYLPYEKDLHLTQHSDQIDTLLNANIITNENIQDLYLYLINGYKAVSDEIQTKVQPLDLTSIGITNNEEYNGEGLYQETELDSLILDQIEISELISSGHIADVNERDFTTKLCANGLLGTGYFVTIEEDGTKKTNYVALSDLYVNMLDNKMIFNASLSINGYKTQLYVDTTALDPVAYSLPLKVDTIKYGNITPSEAITDYLFTFLEGVASGFDWFSCNASEKTLSLEFLPIINESSHATLIKEAVSERGGNLVLKLHGENLTSEDGYLEIGLPETA